MTSSHQILRSAHCSLRSCALNNVHTSQPVCKMMVSLHISLLQNRGLAVAIAAAAAEKAMPYERTPVSR